MATELKKKVGGLAGIIAGDSAICLCGREDESLRYRGYAIEDLASHASFEEIAWLLLRGHLPNKSELEEYQRQLAGKRDLPAPLKEILQKIPGHANMMDVMRTGCSLLGNFEPENTSEGYFAVADRLIACFSSILFYWKKAVDLSLECKSTAEYFLTLLHGKKPHDLQKRCLDAALILYAEHEFNASTFTVRTIASTLSDFYSAICGGIGALRGPLHGGANELALALIQRFDSPSEAEKGVKEMLAKKELIMGFGHRVYTRSDPRSAIIKKWAKRLCKEFNQMPLFHIAESIEKVMWDEKQLFPNLDFYSAVAFHLCEIPTRMFTPLFVISRVAGWSAHLLEQRENNKLIRPLSRYVGPKSAEWVLIDDR